MPTVPAKPEPHRHREMAESFGVDAERYDRARPPYPDALVQRIVASSPGIEVLDVGCGTGIEARQFQAAGCRVLGVEPDPRMARFARGTGVEVEVSTFEAWEPGDRRFDAVVAGTAWHWVDPVAGPQRAAAVLRPGGRLAVFWHTYDLPDAMAEAAARALTDAPFDIRAMTHEVEGYQMFFAKTADGLRATDGFGEPEQWRYDWQRTYTKAEWLDQLPTSGALTRLPAPALAEVLDAVGEVIDAMGGTFTLHYATVAVTTQRT